MSDLAGARMLAGSVHEPCATALGSLEPTSSKSNLETKLRQGVSDTSGQSCDLADRCTIRGRVLFPERCPVVGAQLRLGSAITSSASDGFFELVLDRASLQEGAVLVASLDGFPSAREPDVSGVLLAGASEARADLVMQRESASIRGCVLGQRGERLAGWHIEARPSAETGRVFALCSTHRAISGQDGSFCLSNLQLGSYALFAWRKGNGDTARCASVPAGAEQVLMQLAADPSTTIQGLVSTADGVAPAGIEVRAVDAAFMGWPLRAPVYTDAEGRFTLEDVPAGPVALRVRGAGIEPAYHALSEGGRDRVLVRVARSCTVRVVGRPGGADAIAARDERGRELRLRRCGEASSGELRRLSLLPADASRFEVSRDAATLVLFWQGTEVEFRPCRLDPGSTLVVR